jgi:uncharacterized membrane protein YhaH (DUF805 family)
MIDTYLDSIKIAFVKAFDFKSRAPRAQFWNFYIFTMVVGLLTLQLDLYFNLRIIEIVMPTSGEIIIGHFYIFSYFLFFIPSFSLYVRRLHDVDKSGWWLLIMLIPFIGIITISFFWLLKGNEKNNKYGKPIS